MRHSRQRQAHLDAGERPAERQIVEEAEMADAEHLAGELAKTGAERHIEVIEHCRPEGVGVVPIGHDDRRQ